MNFQTPSSGNMSRLSICMWEPKHQMPMAIEIRVVVNDAFERGHLPAQLSRPRCGQKTRETVEPAPRQFQLIST